MRISRTYIGLGVAAVVASATALYAQDAVVAGPAPVVQQPAPVIEAVVPKLPYGVDEVLKLSRAQIAEDVVLNYVQNSPTVYNLKPNDIVYLKNEGVSDKVIKAMLDKRNAASQQQWSAPPPAADQSAQVPPSQPPAYQPQQPAPVYQQPPQQQPAPVYTQPPTVVESAPSTVYVMPYPPAYNAYYGYPYSYYRPSLSLSFGFGGGHYYGGHYGGSYYGHHGFYGHRRW